MIADHDLLTVVYGDTIASNYHFTANAKSNFMYLVDGEGNRVFPGMQDNFEFPFPGVFPPGFINHDGIIVKTKGKWGILGIKSS